jgi:hypothetical protein
MRVCWYFVLNFISIPSFSERRVATRSIKRWSVPDLDQKDDPLVRPRTIEALPGSFSAPRTGQTSPGKEAEGTCQNCCQTKESTFIVCSGAPVAAPQSLTVWSDESRRQQLAVAREGD